MESCNLTVSDGNLKSTTEEFFFLIGGGGEAVSSWNVNVVKCPK